MYIYCMYVLLQCVYVFMSFCLVILYNMSIGSGICQYCQNYMQEYFYMHMYNIHNNKNYIDRYCIEIL